MCSDACIHMTVVVELALEHYHLHKAFLNDVTYGFS
uniref:Uncharacterized protein n=1 Tax=Arundo donax TaxID=35708 RepID=A0A0A9FUS7_ARUDO